IPRTIVYRRTMVELTILNSMAGQDFAAALDRHLAWDLQVLDLKDAIFGNAVADLSDGEAQWAAGLIQERGLSVYCFSTMFFFADVARGEAWFRCQYIDRIERLLDVASML